LRNGCGAGAAAAGAAIKLRRKPGAGWTRSASAFRAALAGAARGDALSGGSMRPAGSLKKNRFSKLDETVL
jgi:hypothetical protein